MYLSRHCYTCSSLSSVAQGDCVCVLVVVQGCVFMCVSIKFEGGTMVVMVLLQYFQFMNCEGSAMQ